MTFRLFVVDDDRHYSRLLSYRLDKDDSHAVSTFASGEEALDAIEKDAPDLILLDIMMPGIGGMETLRRIRLQHDDLPVVMISAQGTAEVAVEAMQGGANDYITKGQDDLVKLDKVVENLKEKIRLRREVETLRGEVAEKYGLDEIVGDSPAMERVYRLLEKTLRGNLTVAIQGESGTGKELVARAIHFNSAMQPGREGPGPFVVVNCAAIPKELMESEFFGHEKGSFTGAHARHIGKFEQADGGTLFLDEVGELNLELQAKLLRALQNREITRVGGNEVIRFDCRVISATNRDILQMVAEGNFREDLYYRLFQFPVQLPPLRERGDDVRLLAHGFLRDYVKDNAEFKDKHFSSEALVALDTYAWPGNVRELKSTVERAVLVSDHDTIQPTDLLLGGPQAVKPWTERTRPESEPPDSQPPPAHRTADKSGTSDPATQHAPSGDGIAGHTAPTGPTPASPQTSAAAIETAETPDEIVPLDDLKKRAVERAYDLCEGNAERAAEHLGIGRATMYRLIKKYELNDD